MSDTRDQQKLDKLKELFAELSDAGHPSSKQVAEAIEHIQSKGHLTSLGALTDTIAPEGSDREVRRQAQVVATTMPPSGAVDIGRRKAIRSVLGWGATAVAGGTLAGVLSSVVTHELQKPETYAESFVREILRLHSDRPALWRWREALLRSGRTDEAELISALAVHGEGFWDAFTAISRLRELIDAANLTDFSSAYLELNFATHHRYLGLTRQAFDLHESFIGFSTNDPRLNVLLLNHKHMNRHLVLGGLAQITAALPPMNDELARAMQAKLGVDAGAMTASSFEHARNISVECVALKGVFLLNECIAAETEAEALEALDLIDQFRGRVVSALIEPEVSNDRQWMAVRLYGEAVWNYGRIAPIAFLRGWGSLLERCFDAFYSLDAAQNSSEASIMEEYHRIEGSELRSPIWIQMALIRAMHDQITSESGAQSLQRLLPQERQAKIAGHSELQRALDAMKVAFGESATAISPVNSLAAIESPMLLDCVQKMVSRA